MSPIDALIDNYLAAVARETADLPPQRREELLADLRAHIAEARAELHPPTEAGVRTILERLGDPAAIAAEARLSETPAGPPATPAWPGQVAPPPTVAPAPPARSRTGVSVWVAVVLAAVAVAVLGCVAVAVLGLAAFRVSGVSGVSDSVPVPADPIAPRPGPSAITPSGR